MLDLHPCRRKDRYAVVPFTSKDEYQISHTDPIPVFVVYGRAVEEIAFFGD